MADHFGAAEIPRSGSPEKHVSVAEGQEEVNDCPIEQVRLTVPITDDPLVPVLTFRTWVLGMTSCAILAFLNQFFGYRQNQLYISSISAQIITLPLGRLMAATLPTAQIRVPFTKLSFSLNPGPFNLKEHVLITIFANAGSNSVYAVNIITIVKAFYHRDLHPLAAYLLSQTTQVYHIPRSTDILIKSMYPYRIQYSSDTQSYMSDTHQTYPIINKIYEYFTDILVRVIFCFTL
ncbi:unnamed protein product [Ilex paraguariensis]|uniref:Oligopeptide transporter n=1 Tax=Ilex paraguariensis TaxID=185542 RepID=A0ABC8RJD5_9AQUA